MENQSRQHFGINLRRVRQKHQKTQKQLADAMGLSRACIANYERASRKPSILKLQAICEYFQEPAEEFLNKAELASPQSKEEQK